MNTSVIRYRVAELLKRPALTATCRVRVSSGNADREGIVRYRVAELLKRPAVTATCRVRISSGNADRGGVLPA